jgi:hypothetical protein
VDEWFNTEITLNANGIGQSFFEDSNVVRDRDALGRDLSQNTLLVVGTPGGNLWLASHLGTLPIRIGPDRIVADAVYPGTHLKVVTALPNPQNDNRVMIIFTAQRPEDLAGGVKFIDEIIQAGRESYVYSDYVIADGMKVIASGNYVIDEKRRGFEPTPQLPVFRGTDPVDRARKWREDLAYFALELPHRHKNLFFQMKREDFEGAVATLADSITQLQDHEVIVGLMQIIAGVGDAHTRLASTQLEERFRTYPIGLCWFSDGLYVTKTIPVYRRALGARLAKIHESKIEEVCTRIDGVISHENESQLKMLEPDFLVTAEVLHALGVIPNPENACFVFENSEGVQFSLVLNPTLGKETQTRSHVVDPDNLPLYRQKPDTWYWYTYLKDSRTLYLRYLSCQNLPGLSFRDFCRDVFAYVDTNSVDRFVIDLRGNRGGVSSIADPLVCGLKERPKLNRRGNLFVIVDRWTNSSAADNAVRFRDQTEAMVVGEPTGGKPNCYGNTMSFVLPNSCLIVRYSTTYYHLSEKDTPSVMPDIDIRISSTDYFGGKDPMLDAVLSYQK